MPADTASQPISGHKGRDRWICAILTRDDLLTPLELRVAVRLGIFFNCKTGQCDPGYARLAKELCISPRSARRCVAALVAHGFVGRDEGAGGRHDQKRNFSLFMPSARGTDSVSPVRRTDNVSPVETEKPAPHGGPKQGGTGDKNRGVRGTTRRPTKEPDEPEEPDSAALHAARTADADRESAITNSATVNDAPLSQRAPGGALIDSVAAQPQPLPSRVNKKMGPPANADAAEAMRWVQFLNVVQVWKPEFVGDEVAAYEVFCRLMAAGRRLHAVIEDVTSTMLDYGDDPPSLAGVLMTIERNP